MAAADFEYNAWGLEWQDILKAFNGSVEGDFATADECGQFIIEREMELQEGYIASGLNQATLKQLEQVDWHEVCTVNTSGSFSGFVFDFAPDQTKDIKVYVDDNYQSGYNYDYDEVTIPLGCKGNPNCGDFDIADDSTNLETINIYFDSTLNKYVGELDRTIPTEDRILVSYSPDKSALDMPSLARILRDMVACNLGYQLYSAGDNSWKLVDNYCDMGKMSVEKLKNKQWLPSEFKRLKYINPIIPSGFSSVKEWRN